MNLKYLKLTILLTIGCLVSCSTAHRQRPGPLKRLFLGLRGRLSHPRIRGPPPPPYHYQHYHSSPPRFMLLKEPPPNFKETTYGTFPSPPLNRAVIGSPITGDISIRNKAVPDSGKYQSLKPVSKNIVYNYTVETLPAGGPGKGPSSSTVKASLSPSLSPATNLSPTPGTPEYYVARAPGPETLASPAPLFAPYLVQSPGLPGPAISEGPVTHKHNAAVITNLTPGPPSARSVAQTPLHATVSYVAPSGGPARPLPYVRPREPANPAVSAIPASPTPSSEPVTHVAQPESLVPLAYGPPAPAAEPVSNTITTVPRLQTPATQASQSSVPPAYEPPGSTEPEPSSYLVQSSPLTVPQAPILPQLTNAVDTPASSGVYVAPPITLVAYPAPSPAPAPTPEIYAPQYPAILDPQAPVLVSNSLGLEATLYARTPLGSTAEVVCRSPPESSDLSDFERCVASITQQPRDYVRPNAEVPATPLYQEYQPYGVARYAYSYTVASPATGDYKSVHETGHGGGQKTGQYSFLDSDGLVRTVTYTADDEGFHPVVTKTLPGSEVVVPVSVPAAGGGGGHTTQPIPVPVTYAATVPRMEAPRVRVVQKFKGATGVNRRRVDKYGGAKRF